MMSTENTPSVDYEPFEEFSAAVAEMNEGKPAETSPAPKPAETSPAPDPAETKPANIPDDQLRALLDMGMSSTAAAVLHQAGEAEVFLERARAARQAEEKAAEPEPEITLPFTDDEIDPKVRDFLVEQEKKIRALDGAAKRAEAERVAERAAQTAETLFSGLQDQYGDLIGKGKSSDFKADSKEIKNRQLLFTKMNLLADGYASRGQKVDLNVVAKEAALLSFPGHKTAPAERQAVARVTSSQSTMDNSNEDAEAIAYWNSRCANG